MDALAKAVTKLESASERVCSNLVSLACKPNHEGVRIDRPDQRGVDTEQVRGYMRLQIITSDNSDHTVTAQGSGAEARPGDHQPPFRPQWCTVPRE